MGNRNFACIRNNDGEIKMVKRGEVGYWNLPDGLEDGGSAKNFNKIHGFTKPSELESMYMGSMFGWDCPAAQFGTWDGEETSQEGMI